MTAFDDLDFFRGDELIADPYPYLTTCASSAWWAEAHHAVMVTGYEEESGPDRHGHVLVLQLGDGTVPGFPSRSGRRRERAHRAAPRRAAVQRPDHDVRPAQAQGPPRPLMRPRTPKRLKENEDFMWRRRPPDRHVLHACRHRRRLRRALHAVRDRRSARRARGPPRDVPRAAPGRPPGRPARRREHRKLDARQPLEFLYDQLTAYVEERRREPWTTCSRSWPRPRSRTGRRPR